MGKSVYKVRSTRYVYEHLEVLEGVWALLDRLGLTVVTTRELVVCGIQAALEAWIDERVAYTDTKTADVLTEWCDGIEVSVPRGDEDIHDEIALYLEEYFDRHLSELIIQGSWQMVTVHFDIHGILIVDLGPDYRIHDWMKTHRPKYAGAY